VQSLLLQDKAVTVLQLYRIASCKA